MGRLFVALITMAMAAMPQTPTWRSAPTLALMLSVIHGLSGAGHCGRTATASVYRGRATQRAAGIERVRSKAGELRLSTIRLPFFPSNPSLLR